jgi:c-di-GMP-binding flagellar brake protein YcgR
LSVTCTRRQTTRFTEGAAPNLALALKDLGRGGLAFTAAELPPDAHPVEIRIREDATGTMLHARGVVAWVRPRREREHEVYDVGVRFQEILAPAETCARFLDGVAPAAAGATTIRKRRMDRFGITDGDVVVEFDPRFRQVGTKQNLAKGLIDLSRGGAQVACRELLKPGDRVQLTIHLRSFGDVFKAEARTMWVRQGSDTSWRAGLSFCALDHAQERRLQTFERWFSQPEAK